ncbi:hypothetical protein GCM10022223_33970 [Kineosporia mesophila]|uniref:O-antigen/teichoic acid export membrane protein n=1 Tax=Kineosporia mesophila TaxID=566012 RepID=A0ABP6ZQ81_9ACTN|nr:hypothetical protein [Kineosporia mesophila]MCD5354732.1 hypothetical protein [Kineosporia mesophila]
MNDAATPAEPPSSGRSRMLWTFGDQGLSSLSNFALAAVVANVVHSETPEGLKAFGSFGLALVTFSFLIGLGRSAIGDPYVVRYTGAAPATRNTAVSWATGAAVAFGLLSGLLCVAASLFMSGDMRMAMLALGLSMPGLMLQETWRHVFFAEGRPRAAALNDGVWTLLQFGLLAVLLTTPHSASIFLITATWGLSALVAALVGIAQTGVMPALSRAGAWYRETRDINLKMAMDFAFNQGATTLASYLITGIVGLQAMAAIRAAQNLLGPLNLLLAGISAFALPLLARTALTTSRHTEPAIEPAIEPGNGGAGVLRHALAISAVAGAGSGLCLLILLVMPSSVAESLLKGLWSAAHPVLLPMGLVTLAVSLVIGASLGLKALARADQMLRVTLVQAPLMLALSAAGAVWHGAAGAAWGFVAAQTFGLGLCWFIFVRAARAHDQVSR